MTGIEKFQRDEKIRNAIYKHRGSINAISKELGVDIKVVRKVVAELKRKMDNDVKFNLASMIMEKICSGHSQIESVLGGALTALTEHASFEGSLCCNKPVYTREEGNGAVIYCGKCNKLVNDTHNVPNLSVYRMIHDFGKQLDAHYDTLVKFAKEMGFTASEGTTLINQNNIIISDTKNTSGPEDIVDSGFLKDIEKLSPQERRSLSQKILHRIVDCKVIDEG